MIDVRKVDESRTYVAELSPFVLALRFTGASFRFH